MQHTLKIYQKRLTNLTAKNRALLLLKLAKRQFIDLHELDYLSGDPSFRIIEDLIARKPKTVLCDTVDSRDEHTNRASQQLGKIARMDKFIFDEQGARDLYVGYPFVQGRMMDDTPIRCPLLFFPVKLSAVNNTWELELRQDVGVSFNKTLLLAYSHYNGIQFEEAFLDQDFSEFPTDSLEFRTELYDFLKASPFEINFGQETFEDTLLPFSEFNRSTFSEETSTGELKIIREAVLGIFPQAGSYLMPDYEYLLSRPTTRELESFFGSSETEEDTMHSTVLSKAEKEEEMITPYALDASQEKVVKSVKGGNSVVVQGPPGSGKSQMICNMIIDYIARGKNVLVVCQKKAALDVVYKRLGEKNFENFAALVHDFKNDRKEIYDKIAKQIDGIEAFQRENNSLDAIYLERRFLKLSREIDQITEELSEFKTALYDNQECGLSAKELYLSSKLSDDALNLKEEYQHFHFREHEDLLRKFRSYFKYANSLDKSSHPWASRVSFKDFGIEDLQEAKRNVAEVIPYFEKVSREIAEQWGFHPSYDECEWILDREEAFYKFLELLGEESVFRYFKNSLPHSEADYLWLANKKKNLLNAYGVEGVESTIPKEKLGECQKILKEALEAHEVWYHRLKWKYFSKEKAFVDELIAKNGLENEEEPLMMLLQKLDNRLNLEHHLTILSKSPFITEQPNSYDPEVLRDWLDLHLKALDAKNIYEKLRNIIKYIKLDDLSYDELSKKVTSLLQTLQDIPAKSAVWKKYLTTKQIKSLLDKNVLPETLEKSLDKDFDSLCEFDRLKDTFMPHELVVAKKVKEKVEKVPEVEEGIYLIDNSIRLAWLNHLESKYPVLRIVSSLKLSDMESHLQEAMSEKRNISREIALIKLRERTYQEVEFNRLKNMVTYRDLKHQVNKKRSIWPLRKLISNFSHELLNLVPCWMASPESVSTIFPMEEFFDLVIFDEASQCFAEKGIPAMYRGKQVVIAGDSQQLAPFDLYQPRWEEDMEGETALEVDSLLDLGAHYLQEIPLTGHYRSKSLDLIGFSNRHFYDNRLQLIPDFQNFVGSGPAISYLKVDGVWEKNQNYLEAQEVVRLVEKLIGEGKDDIGIITFNFKQQDLILDLLEESGIAIPPRLFVKNIENVQGDERDIIIFSIAYAPSPSGVMRVQFGSLSQAKGENRLNVAVTRARSAVYVVSSILPHQLRVEETKNQGPKLLQQYLQYALEVSEGNFKPNLPALPLTNSTQYLKDKVKEEMDGKLEMDEFLPFSDLTFKKETWEGLVLTDDNQYFQGISPKEAHAYAPVLLKEKGWRFRRFYSRQFWIDPAGFKEALFKFTQLPMNEGAAEE
ncbi:AAA domain-containing protein [Flammeovirgaceae bacterium SG7u.111]|nr:AAA domain-containing protein [Flammeovirgaceae bacterium SG7u.132]WPO36128.1 AAA domain-containing protein [Flammeovirgaceae bacterium SG7u.111]